MFDSNPNNVYGGYYYNPNPNQQMQQKHGSTLSADEYNRLLKQDSPFSLALTETELTRGRCNHRSLDGTRDMLVADSDGSVRCSVCGYKFRPVDSSMSKEEVQEATNLLTDILQTIKLLFIDMPIDAQREYFQIIPLIEKIPDLFQLAVNNFNKHENYNNWQYRGQNMGTMNLFNMLSGAMNNQAFYGGFQQQQMGGNQFGQPTFGAFGTPVNGFNPNMAGFSYGNMQNPAFVNNGYNPQTTGFQYGNPQQQVNPMTGQPQQVPYQMDPNAASQQVGSQVQSPSTATTDGKDVTVNTTLKA